jgi:phosphoribosylanthranilate isomerase
VHPEVKICGLTRAQDAALAGRLGAAYVGTILAESPRRLTPDRARAIFAAAPGARGVCVFGHGTPADIAEAAELAGASIVQLHGDHSLAEVREVRHRFRGEIWIVAKVSDSLSLPDELLEVADALVLDTADAVRLGGTGRSFDWTMASRSLEIGTRPRKLVLAGGLRPSNVGDAISQLHPDVLDVSSGVESSTGIKDPALLSAFVEAVGRSVDR